MRRTTIDIGIDLGTTNSAIAILNGTRAEILKNKDQHDITPSAVCIDKRRGVFVGERAKQQLREETQCHDVHIEFKTLMGQQHYHMFQTTGQRRLPEELSSEVLKELRTSAQTRLGADISAAVITVPAAFELKQCAATRKAGELAGISQCPLLLEPVAAALAYGFQADVSKEYWLVYDFGGGTFDAAVIKAEEGTISVVNHRGDNHLGGSDIDWDIVEKLVVPRAVDGYNLPDFTRGNDRWKAQFYRMKHAAEEAKIDLSGKETSVVECSFDDADGKKVDIYLDIKRSEVMSLAQRHIEKSLEICRRALVEKSLAPGAVARMILVGGPTLAPYWRQMLQDGLGIPLDVSCDPLTVVAQGAAIFAGTQHLAEMASPRVATDQFRVDLHYKPIGPDENPIVRGHVQSANKTNLDGYTIELVNTKTFWRSGKVRLASDGRFRIQLLAESGCRNEFAIELLNPTGGKQSTTPDHLVYTMGLAVSDMPVINPFAVALADNGAPCYIERGVPLPARVTRTHTTAVAVKKGGGGDVLTIPVVEGENPRADRNKLMGCLEICGDKIRRDLPAGSEVEVTLTMDTSRILTLRAYIPLLDEEFEMRIDFERRTPDAVQLQRQFGDELKRIDELKQKAVMAENADGLESLAKIEEDETLKEIRSLISAARGDAHAAKKVEAMLLELKIRVDMVEDSLAWPALVSEAQSELDQLDDVIARFGQKDCVSQARNLHQEVEELVEQKRHDRLSKKVQQIRDAHMAIVVEQPGWWVGLFEYLVTEREQMQDTSAADQLINQGRQCIDRGNLDGLKQTVRELLNLLPKEEAESIRRGYGSGII